MKNKTSKNVKIYEGHIFLCSKLIFDLIILSSSTHKAHETFWQN